MKVTNEVREIDDCENVPVQWREQVRCSWPQSLRKAMVDPFNYTLQLRSTGQRIMFEYAEFVNLTWVHLAGVQQHNLGGWPQYGDGFSFARGLDLRIDDIAWVSDAGGYDS